MNQSSTQQSMLTAYFEQTQNASRAQDALMQAGIARSNLTLITGERSAGDQTRQRYTDQLTGLGLPQNDANSYAQGLSQGGAVIVVRAVEQDRVQQAADTLENNTPASIDRFGQQSQSGASGSSSTAASGNAAQRSGGQQQQNVAQRDQSFSYRNVRLYRYSGQSERPASAVEVDDRRQANPNQQTGTRPN